MQAVILAAGRGSRMGGLTEKRPKPMLEVSGKTILEHSFDALPEDVTEIIIVVGYLAHMITEHYGEAYGGKKLTYVTQENIVGGTADALWKTRSLLKDRFFVMMGDNIHVREDIVTLRALEWALALGSIAQSEVGGRAILSDEGHIVDIVEGSKGGEGLVSTNLFMLDTRLFDYPLVPKAHGSSELGLPQTVLAASAASGIPLSSIEATRWIQLTSPEDIQRAEALLTEAR